MATTLQPKMIRKSLSLLFVGIGAFILFVNLVLVGGKKSEMAPIVAGISLVAIGGALYLGRVQEEKRLNAPHKS